MSSKVHVSVCGPLSCYDFDSKYSLNEMLAQSVALFACIIREQRGEPICGSLGPEMQPAAMTRQV